MDNERPMPEPMSAEWRQSIKARAEAAFNEPGTSLLAIDVLHVLAELDRVTAERDEAALLADAERIRASDIDHDRDRAEAALARVRTVHYPIANSTSAKYPNPLCGCGNHYPCATIRALEGATDE